MTKTFKSVIHDHLSLQVVRLTHEEISVGVLDRSKLLKGLTVGATDAPAIALAFLEAAGVQARNYDGVTVGTSEDLSQIVMNLKNYIDQEAYARVLAAKEAADREALEGDAWELWKAFNPGTVFTSWASLTERHRDDFLRVAHRARELNGGSK